LLAVKVKSADFRKKIEVFSEGKARRKFFSSGFAFERLTFLSKVENLLKRGKIRVKVSQEKTSWIPRNVWVMAIYGFCLSLFTGFVAMSF
jgi:hypothetical protein